MTSFKVSKKGKYFQIDYISNLPYLPINYWGYIWSLNKSQARKFIEIVRDVEKFSQEIIKRDSLKIDYRLLVLMHLKAIDSISTGIDIRSGKSNLELAEDFVWSYNKKYNEAQLECLETREYFEKDGKSSSYMKNWRKYDKYNELIREFYFDLAPIGMNDFEDDELKNMEVSLDKMLELIKSIKE